MNDATQTADVKCPKCGHQTNMKVPQKSCLPMYSCEGCSEIITIPAESENCCVVCEYSEDKCLIPNKHKE